MGVYLQRADSTRQLDDAGGAKTGEIFGPYQGDGLKSWLGEFLDGYARSENLRRLAEQGTTVKDPLVDVTLALQRQGEPLDPLEATKVRDGDVIELSVNNTGLHDVSLVVFYVDNAYRIAPFFPVTAKDYGNNYVPSGKELYEPIKFQINDSTLGWEHVIVIAVDAKDQQAVGDVLRLQQAGFRSRSSKGEEYLGPLGRLIADTVSRGYRAASRPDAVPSIGSYAIRRISWNVVSTNPPGRGAPQTPG
jgi:hypothetical protein